MRYKHETKILVDILLKHIRWNHSILRTLWTKTCREMVNIVALFGLYFVSAKHTLAAHKVIWPRNAMSITQNHIYQLHTCTCRSCTESYMYMYMLSYATRFAWCIVVSYWGTCKCTSTVHTTQFPIPLLIIYGCQEVVTIIHVGCTLSIMYVIMVSGRYNTETVRQLQNDRTII